MPIVFKSGSLSLLEPSGPVQACNGIALPLPLPFLHRIVDKKIGVIVYCNITRLSLHTAILLYSVTVDVAIYCGSNMAGPGQLFHRCIMPAPEAD